MIARKELHRGLSVAGFLVLAPLLVGCVTQKKYNDTLDKLDQAKMFNEDLVKKYNQLVEKLNSRPAVGSDVTEEEYERVRAQVARLRDQLAQRDQGLAFTPKDRSKVAGSEDEDGGLRLGEELLFRPGEHRLKEQVPALDQLAQVLKYDYPDEFFIIEGHTDNQPLRSVLHTMKDNSNLGYQRARSVFTYLNERHAIPKSRMVVVTYGFSKPVDPDLANSDEGRRQNRRVVIRRRGGHI